MTTQAVRQRAAGGDRLALLEVVLELVSKRFGLVDRSEVFGGRGGTRTRARQVAMHVLRCATGCTLQDLGGLFSRDHSTVHYALKRVEARYAADSRAVREALERELKPWRGRGVEALPEVEGDA